VLERVHDEYSTYCSDEPDAEQRLAGAERPRLALTGFETGDRAERGADYLLRYREPRMLRPVTEGRVTTLDDAGALTAGVTALDRPPHNGADQDAFARHQHRLFADPDELAVAAAEARRRCAAGDPAEALVLGRDLHWASIGDPRREAWPPNCSPWPTASWSAPRWPASPTPTTANAT
jgi:hypothetical protein